MPRSYTYVKLFKEKIKISKNKMNNNYSGQKE